MRSQRFWTLEEAVDAECMFWRYLNKSGKIASTIGSNACTSAYILMGNILKNNEAICEDYYLFLFFNTEM